MKGTQALRHTHVRRLNGTVVLKPGTYRLADTIANHENLGQYGTLIVRNWTLSNHQRLACSPSLPQLWHWLAD